ncbi:MAG: geranylgeranylglyceryl/heptaprenylglyceryl phosphate synthase [Methanobacteriales archaeon Met13]
MIVEEYLQELLKKGKVHLTLLDPEEQTPSEALKKSQEAVAAGSHGIMLGGSITNAHDLDATAKILRENLEVPIILFPGNTSGVSTYAHAIFFMSVLNSTNPYWIIGAQALGAPIIKRTGIQTIPMGYVVVEPGGTVGWVGDAKPIPRNKPDIAVAYALAAEFLGMRFFYLEAGSGVDKHVPAKMIGAVKKYTNLTLVVGGGIRTKEVAQIVAAAGADIIVTGTVVEESYDVKNRIKAIMDGINSI